MTRLTTDAIPTSRQFASKAQAYHIALERHTSRQDFESHHNNDDRDTDDLITRRDALMQIPAPDHSALLAKLRILLEPGAPDEFTTEWSRKYIAQTLADMERLLSSN